MIILVWRRDPILDTSPLIEIKPALDSIIVSSILPPLILASRPESLNVWMSFDKMLISMLS